MAMYFLDAVYSFTVARYPDAIELRARLLSEDRLTERQLFFGMRSWDFWKAVLLFTLGHEHGMACQIELANKGYSVLGRQRLALPDSLQGRDPQSGEEPSQLPQREDAGIVGVVRAAPGTDDTTYEITFAPMGFVSGYRESFRRRNWTEALAALSVLPRQANLQAFWRDELIAGRNLMIAASRAEWENLSRSTDSELPLQPLGTGALAPIHQVFGRPQTK